MILENATPFERDTYLTETSLSRLIKILLSSGPLSTLEIKAKLPNVETVLEIMRIKGIVEPTWKLIKKDSDEPEQSPSSEVKS